MRLLYCDARHIPAGEPLCPAGSGRKGSALGMSLLLRALEAEGVAHVLPEIRRTETGRPYFPELPELHFSVSHSGGFLLCAVDDRPVGVDIELRRPLRPGTEARLMCDRERELFDFFELWTLRESYFKLTGRGSLRHTAFARDAQGRPAAPEAGVFCRLYGELPEAAAAVCSFRPELPEHPEPVAPICLLR